MVFLYEVLYLLLTEPVDTFRFWRQQRWTWRQNNWPFPNYELLGSALTCASAKRWLRPHDGDGRFNQVRGLR